MWNVSVEHEQKTQLSSKHMHPTIHAPVEWHTVSEVTHIEGVQVWSMQVWGLTIKASSWAKVH